MATATSDPRLERLERRAESDDETIHSILRILERMDQRLAALEADVARLKSDTSSIKADVDSAKTDVANIRSTIVDTVENAQDRGFGEYRLLGIPPSLDRQRPFAFSR